MGENEMSNDLQQAGRVASLTTPLGENVLVLAGFDGVEGLSELYEFRIDALSKEENVDFNQILGRACSVRFKMFGAGERHFSGVAVEAQAIGMRNDLFAYRLVLRPTLWFLTRTTNCRIFHQKTAHQVIKDVLKERGVQVKDLTDAGSYPKLDYCVQYRETDFAFVSRLMEHHGIYYYFTHDGGQSTMVLADKPSSHEAVNGLADVRFMSSATAAQAGEQCLVSWSAERRFRSGKVEFNDYNFTKPGEELTAQAQAAESYERASDYEMYDYPAKYAERDHGNLYAKVRLQAEQAIDYRRFAGGEAVSLYPGGLVNLSDHPKPEENKQYLVVRCTHHFSDEAFRSVANTSIVDRPYLGNYELMPADRPFRAPIVTPKPVIQGPQTARVVASEKSKDSEEIDVDEEGHCIKVRFFWDRVDARSCWVRVAQTWAGPGWGGQFIPRIGMEVVVVFLEGDPDRPLVVGCVYNGKNKPPYPKSDKKTQSGLRSDSSKGHGGYNELMFEDKKGSEDIRMHAQKDHNVTVLNVNNTEIGREFSGSGNTRATKLVNGDDLLTLSKGSQTVAIDMGSHKMTVMQTIDLISQSSTITLKTGASTIKITPSSIELSSLQIKLSATKIDLN